MVVIGHKDILIYTQGKEKITISTLQYFSKLEDLKLWSSNKTLVLQNCRDLVVLPGTTATEAVVTFQGDLLPAFKTKRKTLSSLKKQ